MRLLAIVFLASVASAQVNVIFDDDCTSDVDCASTFATLHKLADRGEVTILATMANSANTLAAPAMKVFNTYYGRGSVAVGANQTSNPSSSYCTTNTCNTSAWLSGLISAYDSGDTRSNYTDCITLYRQKLAAASSASVVIVETGFMTCLNGLLTSPADGISASTGAQLIQAKVSKLVVMGGDYPSSSGEFNFASDPTDTSNVFSTWTTGNGYPPIYLVGFTAGQTPQAGPTTRLPDTFNPTFKAFELASTNQRPVWDSMAVLYAARGLSNGGLTYWTLSAAGTNTVDSSTGANSWSSGTNSGHYYLTDSATSTQFSQILDGYTYTGFAWQSPIGTHVAGQAQIGGKATVN